MSTAPRSGPIEDGTWPPTLEAHVVDPGPPRRIHGYAAVGDLVRHHTATEIALLTYTGELPSEAAVRMFDVALAVLAPVAITEAAAHAAVLARLLAAPDANVIALATMIAADRAERVVAEHATWLAWCRSAQGDPPPAFLDEDEPSAAVVRERLAATGIDLPTLAPGHRPTATATALALLHASGVRDPLHLAAVIVAAQLPCLIAEAQRHAPRRLGHYPIGVPPFDYVEDPG